MDETAVLDITSVRAAVIIQRIKSVTGFDKNENIRNCSPIQEDNPLCFPMKV